jgi:hypothetical protein
MDNKPTAFISYSHSDRDFVSHLSDDLMKQGIKIWIDQFDLLPGDSLIQKIFSEGLAQSKFFLIVLSPASAASKWVKEELDAAMIAKIQGVTRIIPIIKEPSEIPVPLRSLLYVDLSREYDEGIRKLVQTMHGVFDKPSVGALPKYISDLKQSVGGLSKIATTLGASMLTRADDQRGYEPQMSAQDLALSFPSLTPEEINDGIEELESFGLVKAHKVIGNAPYYFAFVIATYALFLHFKDEGMAYDPEQDVKEVAAAIAGNNEITGAELQRVLKLSPGRINRAVAYLEEYGLARVIRKLGTAPYDFREVNATRQTRNFVNEISS